MLLRFVFVGSRDGFLSSVLVLLDLRLVVASTRGSLSFSVDSLHPGGDGFPCSRLPLGNLSLILFLATCRRKGHLFG